MDFGEVQFYIARHFGFCFGVENAIEISYKALEECGGKKVYLLSQMIHNQEVNRDLENRGIQFILDTNGQAFIPWDKLKPDDIIIIPAFGTTLEIEKELSSRGLDIKRYNTTCPFVEKVWNRSRKLGEEGFTVIIHGKPTHEETRATFSHSADRAKSIIIRDLEEAKLLAEFIRGQENEEKILLHFKGRYSEDFNPGLHLNKIGVVNQTTMLATHTQAISDYFKQVMVGVYGQENLKNHFADTRDTLCYATNDNQNSTYELLKTKADLAIVVGGYNSSNTSHLVELCENEFPTYFINSEEEIKSFQEIHHFDLHRKELKSSLNFLPSHQPAKIVLTSGASCPDTIVDRVMLKVLSFYKNKKSIEEVFTEAGIKY